jgi:hypothetical protein
MFDEFTEFLRRLTLRVERGQAKQTGFWYIYDFIFTCCHGFDSVQVGDTFSILDGVSNFDAVAIGKDESLDILLLKAAAGHSAPVQGELAYSASPGDSVDSWVYSERYGKGESLSLEVEGWGLDPFHVKLKGGQVSPGMSGAPLVMRGSHRVIGMLRVTRDRDTALGGRAVPSDKLLELASRVTPQTGPLPNPKDVGREEVPLVLGMLEASYQDAKPLTSIQLSSVEDFVSTTSWAEGEKALKDLRTIHDINQKRRGAVNIWHVKNRNCLRFVVAGCGVLAKRIGATCVLPLTSKCYFDYVAGVRSEFEIEERHIIGFADGGKSRWLCFQSFGLVQEHRLGKEDLFALRRSIVRHVHFLSDCRHGSGVCVVAEIGTSAGFRQAHHFGMEYRRLSKEGRPLFEQYYDRNSPFLSSESEALL